MKEFHVFNNVTPIVEGFTRTEWQCPPSLDILVRLEEVVYHSHGEKRNELQKEHIHAVQRPFELLFTSQEALQVWFIRKQDHDLIQKDPYHYRDGMPIIRCQNCQVQALMILIFLKHYDAETSGDFVILLQVHIQLVVQDVAQVIMRDASFEGLEVTDWKTVRRK